MELRKSAKHMRLQLTSDGITKRSARICKSLLGILGGSDPVMVYVLKPQEVNTHDLIKKRIMRGKRVIVPIIEREKVSLRLSYLDDRSVLVKSTFYAQEPIGSEQPVLADNVQTAVIPVLAFDRHGDRIGYGAGYNDRFFYRPSKSAQNRRSLHRPGSKLHPLR